MPAVPVRFPLPLLLAISLAACDGGAPAPLDEAPPEVRVYAVPPGQTDTLAEALNDVMDARNGAAAIGHASPRIPGQLVVRAPASVHASVAQTLEELTRERPARVEAARTLRIWRVDVRPGADRGLARMAGQEAALEALRKRFPGQGMVLADEISLALPTTLGTTELMTGDGTQVFVRTLPGELPTFDLSFQSRRPGSEKPTHFESRLALPAGETIIAATLNRDGSDPEGASVVLMQLEVDAP